MRRNALPFTLLAAFALFTVLCFSMGAKADDNSTAAKAKKEPWNAEDVIYAEYAQQMRISPNAQYLVWVKSTGDKEKDARVSNLFLSSLTAPDKTLALTRGSDNNGQPQWSPDGQLIAFTSNRARYGAKPETAPVQIWLINPYGGEPWLLTELVRPPRRIDWLLANRGATDSVSIRKHPDWLLPRRTPRQYA